jgi:hypothetical protein
MHDLSTTTNLYSGTLLSSVTLFAISFQDAQEAAIFEPGRAKDLNDMCCNKKLLFFFLVILVVV